MDADSRIVDFVARGKRKRRESRAANDRQPSEPRRRGRPMMTASQLHERARKAPPKPCLPAKTRSWLERLPVELIEQIFLQALEINMAKASPFLGKALSSKESIYRVLILFAFFDDDGQNPVEEKHFAPATYRLLSTEEKLRLQRGVLDSRWLTLSRLRQCRPLLLRLGVVQEWHDKRNKRLEGPKAGWNEDAHEPQQQPPSSPFPPEDIPSLQEYHDAFDTAMVPTPSTPEWVEFIRPAYTTRTWFNARYIPNRVFNPLSWHNSANSGTHESDAIDLLYTLSCSWLINHTQKPMLFTGSPEALFLGIETAIRERHRKALELLVCIRNWGAMSEFLMEDAFPQIPERIINLGTRQGEDSGWIVPLLVRDIEKGLQVLKDDSVLTKWALEQHEEGSKFAMHLLDVL